MAIEVRRSPRNPVYQGFLLLRAAFVVAPILFGIDKFFNFMVDWPKYLAPWIADIVHVGSVSPQQFMYLVGAVEIVAGILVLFAPRVGSVVVALWLAGIVINLLTGHAPNFYDIALRDFGLFLAAVALNRLASALEINTIRTELQPARARRVTT